MRSRGIRLAGRLLLGACLLGGLAAAGHAGEDPFASAWQTLATEAAHDYGAFAAWCHKRKLFGARNEAYEIVLLFAPEDGEARRRLKYHRAPDGTWTRGRYRAPRNLEAPGSAYEKQKAGLAGRFVDRGLALLAAHAKNLASSRRQATLRVLQRLDPAREDVRVALGERRDAAGRWRLAESLGAPARRADLRARAAGALHEAAAPKKVRPNRLENALGLAWTEIVATPAGRLLGTVPRGEVQEGARRLEACAPVFRSVFDGTLRSTPPLTIFLLATPKDRTKILEHHPKSSESYRTWAPHLQSSWFPKTRDVWIQTPEKDLRLEWISRQAFGKLLSSQFGLRGRPGWAFEGFGLYLSHLVAGQRKTFFVKRTKYGEKVVRKDDLWTRLRDKKTDWRAEARTLLASPRAPDLRLLLGKPLAAMNTEDMLVSFVLAAFLLEGRPKEVPALLDAVGRRKRPSIDVLAGAGLDPATLGIKLRRWLRETK